MSAYQTPIPGAPQYEQANLLARRAYENATNRLQQRRSQSLLHYGYTQGADGSFGVDPNNEYGQYQQMLRGQDQSSHRLERAQHASGWGGGGYLGQQTDELQHQQGGEQAALGEAATGEFNDIANQEKDAAYTRDQALVQNEQDAAQRAIDQGNFNPADYTGTEADYGQQEPAAPPKGGKGGGKGHLQQRANLHQQAKARLLREAAKRTRGRRR